MKNNKERHENFKTLSDGESQYLWIIQVAQAARDSGKECPFMLELDNDQTLIVFTERSRDDDDYNVDSDSDYEVLKHCLGQDGGVVDMLSVLHIKAEFP